MAYAGNKMVTTGNMTPGKIRSIEHLVIWAIQSQSAHKVVGRAVAGLSPSGYRSSLTKIGEIAQLGTMVDYYGSAGMGNDDLDPEAEAVVDCLHRMGRTDQQVIMAFAMTGERPDWVRGAVPKSYGMFRDNGKPVIDRWHDGVSDVVWCVLRESPVLDHVRFRHAEWTLWFECMNALAERLRLAGVDVDDLSCERQPWTDDWEKTFDKKNKFAYT